MRLSALLLFGLMLVASCSSSNDTSPSEPHQSATAPEDRDHPAPSTCDSQTSERLIQGFLDSYNEGSISEAAMDNFFAPPGEFQWFSDEASRHDDQVGDRDGLSEYFAQQHAAGDELSLVSYSYNGYRAEDSTAHFHAVLRRQGLTLTVKGALGCGSGKIIVWSAGLAA